MITTEMRLPHNLDAERALLGSILLDSRIFDTILEIIPKSALPEFKPPKQKRQKNPGEPLFFSAVHQIVFSALQWMHSNGIAIGLETLAATLHDSDQLDVVGGSIFLADLEDDIFTLNQANDLMRMIVEKWQRRSLIRACSTTMEEAVTNDSLPEVLSSAEQGLLNVAMARQTSDFTPVADGLPDHLQQIHLASSGSIEAFGLSTGFPSLDRMTGGLRGGQLVIIAARPSVGKSAFALNIAEHISIQRQLPVGIFSMEMSATEWRGRLLASISGVPIPKLQGRVKIGHFELDEVDRAAGLIQSAPIFIDETASNTEMDVRSKARRLKMRQPALAALVIDYLQLASASGRNDNRQQEVAKISRSLKILAMELGIPVIALSQLSRESEKRTGKDRLPRLADLRDSGAIEQDADIVLFLHRENMQDASRADVQEATLIIGKQRNGPLGKVDLIYKGDQTRFSELASHQGAHL